VAEVVWYVAYGSNLSEARFREYVDEPLADRPTTIGHRVWFGGESVVWTGGRAYLDHEPAPGRVTLARAWLLDVEQWDHLHARENGGGNYPTVLDLGEHEGAPVRSFTCGDRHDPAACTRPAIGYLRTIATGLHEAHGLDVEAAAAYLVGCTEHWTEADLLTGLRSVTNRSLPRREHRRGDG
jgi:hypothetical protein